MRDKPVISLRLTKEQREAVKRLTGKDAVALELSVEELEHKLMQAEMLGPDRGATFD